MNCFFKICSVALLFANVISAQEIPTTQNQSANLQLEKPSVNQTKKLGLLLPFNLNRVQNDTVNSVVNRLKKDKFLNMTLPPYRDWETDRKSTRLNSSHLKLSRMPSSA